jgi:OmpA-OmpF porin, OOP family
MSETEIHLNRISGRGGRVDGKATGAEVCQSLFNPAVNPGSYANADRHQSVSFPYGMQPTGSQFTINHLKFLWRTYMKKTSILNAVVMSSFLALSVSVMAQDNSAQMDSRKMQTQVASGQKMKVQGTVLSHDADKIVVRDTTGSEVTVQLASNTKIEEKKGNPFRGSKKYTADQVIRGLYVEVEGRGDASGSIVADKVKFSADAQRTAVSINSTVVPVENRVGQAETRLSEAEQNAQRLSGQVEELSQVANLANGGAQAAQKSADQAIEGVNKTNDRISSLDDFEEKNTATVNFKVGSAVLTPEGKATLDQVVASAKNEKGYVLEVRGFASSDGSEGLNDRLSERRADAVMHYLAQHEIPLRRIVLPFGYGEAMPVADNNTREGRKQNRRVEVKLMVNRGLTNPVNVDHSATTSTGSTGTSEN